MSSVDQDNITYHESKILRRFVYHEVTFFLEPNWEEVEYFVLEYKVFWGVLP